MPYVRRDASGQVVALSTEPLEGFEHVAFDLPEIAEFEQRLGNARSRLEESDRDVVRVLDDLVNLLIDKNLIRFTDLPVAAQRKLIERRGLRETGTHLGLLGEDTGLL
ncbi:MAG: tryptophan synthase subunit beta [Pseudomonadales bacterium]|jgi:hypothetical protein|nr:tryptophan synthase subunit beta [Pseudomonadales bacterium]